jgi:hypothetical protein
MDMFRYVEHKTQQLNMSETKQLCLPNWGTILHSVFSEAMWVSVKMEGLKTLCLSSYQRQIHPKIKPNSSKSHSAPESHIKSPLKHPGGAFAELLSSRDSARSTTTSGSVERGANKNWVNWDTININIKIYY